MVFARQHRHGIQSLADRGHMIKALNPAHHASAISRRDSNQPDSWWGSRFAVPAAFCLVHDCFFLPSGNAWPLYLSASRAFCFICTYFLAKKVHVPLYLWLARPSLERGA